MTLFWGRINLKALLIVKWLDTNTSASILRADLMKNISCSKNSLVTPAKRLGGYRKE